MGPMTEAVLAVLRDEGQCAPIAQRHGVSEQILREWRDRFVAAGETALGELLPPPSPAATTTRQLDVRLLQEQLAEKDRLIQELTNENRLLEKLAHPAL